MNILSRSVLIILAAMLVACMASAQVMVVDRSRETPLKTDVFGLGFAGGPASGVGISFRHHLPSQFSYQLIGGVFRATDRLYYSVGSEFQYDVSRSSFVRFYAAGGVSYFFSGLSGHNDMEGPFRAGIGLGAETQFASGFHISGDLLFTYFGDGMVLPLPQIGFHYYFY